MSLEQFQPTPSYLIEGVGPYTIRCAYRHAEDLQVFVWDDGVLTELALGADYTVSPTQAPIPAPAGGGALTLSAAVAQICDGALLQIDRRSLVEQAWAGVTSREKGLERQLDRLTMGVQDALRLRDGYFRLPPGADFDPVIVPPGPGRLLVAAPDGRSFVPGPLASELPIGTANMAGFLDMLRTAGLQPPVTYRIPEDYPDLHTLARHVQPILPFVQWVYARISAGHRLTRGGYFEGCPFMHKIRVVADDPIVFLAPSYVGENITANLHVGNAVIYERTGILFGSWLGNLPTIECVIDMEQAGGTAYYVIYGGDGYVMPDCGVLNAGYHAMAARSGSIHAHHSVWAGAKGSAARLAYNGMIDFQQSDISNACSAPEVPNQGLIDCSRFGRAYARLSVANGSGGALINARRGSSVNFEGMEANGPNAYGALFFQSAAGNSGYGCTIRDVTNGPSLSVSTQGGVSVPYSDIRGGGLLDLEVLTGGTIVAKGTRTTGSGSSSPYTPALAYTNVAAFNVTSEHGTIFT